MTTISLARFVSEVKKTNTIFGVKFTKKNGDIRSMQARMHVSKGVKGVLPVGHRKAEDSRCNVLTVYDMQVVDANGGDTKGAFRRINLEGIISVSLRGKRYTIA